MIIKRDNSPARNLKRFSAVPFIALALTLSAEAAEWTAQPSITLRTGYNENIRLTTIDHDSVQESALSPSVKFGFARENQGLSGDAGFAIRKFTGGSGRESGSVLDREDYHLDVGAYHGNERNTFRGGINYVRDSTLDSELDETGNVIDDRATRDRITISPSWERILSEKMQLGLFYQFSNIGYTGASNLVEYDYHVLSSSLIRQLTPRVQGNIDASYSLYRPENDINSDTISLQAGISRNFSETLEASFSAGQRRTKSDTFVPICFGLGTYPSCPFGFIFTEDEVNSSGLVFSASIEKRLETGSMSATLSRSSSPAGDGELLDTTRLRLSGIHNFSNNIQSSLFIDVTERETIVNRFGQEANQENESFIRIRPYITYRWNRKWDLSGNYEYARNENISSDTATRNAVYLTLGYRPAKASLSR